MESVVVLYMVLWIRAPNYLALITLGYALRLLSDSALTSLTLFRWLVAVRASLSGRIIFNLRHMEHDQEINEYRARVRPTGVFSKRRPVSDLSIWDSDFPSYYHGDSDVTVSEVEVNHVESEIQHPSAIYYDGRRSFSPSSSTRSLQRALQVKEV